MTRRTRSGVREGALGLVVLCALAGCSADPTPELVATAATSADTPFGTYLSAYRNAGIEREDANAVRWGEDVAACMKLEGFEYVPFDGVTVTTFTAAPDTGSHAWTAEHGYGITSQSNVVRSDEGPGDPNAPIVAAMSPAERDAYGVALWGGADGITEGASPDAGSGSAEPTDGGCAAGASASSDSDWADDPTYTHLEAEYTALVAQVDVDPAVVATLADWRACMSAAGHPGLTTSVDAQMSIQTEMDALAGSNGSVADAAALAGLRDREIDLAVVDRTCAIDTRVDRTRTDAQRALETAYVEAHRAELDAWIELSGGLGG